jgi:hypothetical protein
MRLFIKKNNMKKGIWILVLLLCVQSRSHAQVQELQQLILNIEKLAQFKQILKDMKAGYEILTKGYNTIKNISEGNFNLHKAFLDALLEVSPAVRKYKKIADIIDMQVELTKKYKIAFSRFKASDQFTIEEIDYLGRVYERLFDQSIRNLDDLAMVITANKLRMSDEERLAAIDRIFADMEDKLAFLNDFNGRTGILAQARAEESSDVKTMRGLHGKE